MARRMDSVFDVISAASGRHLERQLRTFCSLVIAAPSGDTLSATAAEIVQEAGATGRIDGSVIEQIHGVRMEYGVVDPETVV